MNESNRHFISDFFLLSFQMRVSGTSLISHLPIMELRSVLLCNLLSTHYALDTLQRKNGCLSVKFKHVNSKRVRRGLERGIHEVRRHTEESITN